MRSIAFTHKESSTVTDSDSAVAVAKLEGYRAHLTNIAISGGYDMPESSINLPFDETQDITLKKAVSALASDRLKLIVVVGIGGSSLGSYALYQARYGWADALLTRAPKLLYLDALSPAVFTSVMQAIEERVETAEELLVFVISKSGMTTETLANAEALIAHLGARFGNPSAIDRVVYLADDASPLAERARGNKWNFINTIPTIGGRWGVFTLAHLVPLALAGLNISLLLEGAREGRERGLIADPEENDALTMAALRSVWEWRGFTAHNLFIFAPQCAALGSWWRQLNAESLGKDGKGMLPLVSVGSTDLHSLGQLYLGGTGHIATTFMSVEHEAEDPVLPTGKSFSTINRAILAGVEETYRNHQLPYAKIVLPEVNERAIGAWMQTEMLATMYHAQLLGVNAFDQPNVEEYKTAARGYLAS